MKSVWGGGGGGACATSGWVVKLGYVYKMKGRGMDGGGEMGGEQSDAW